MENIINAITENWEFIAGGILGAFALFKMIARFTKTKKDDAAAEKIEDLLEGAGIKKG